MNDLESAKNVLLSKKSNISRKMRTLFYLRNECCDESAKIIEGVFSDVSVLLRHEAAYVLGQMRRPLSKTILLRLLQDEEENEIVRHEAGEALGNYRDPSLLAVLEKYLNHKSSPIRETCYLAYKKIEESLNGNREDIPSPFNSYDPAYPLLCDDIQELSKIYLDPRECLYKRYGAMFALRDMRSEESVHILGKGFFDSSELFKHEIAFVLGQLHMDGGTEGLGRVLESEDEHEMVRHECAEALGAIGTDRSKDILLPHLQSGKEIVRESVEVALDIHSYEEGVELEYAIV
jgi:deoxyhypusine monooxygenase